MLKVITLGRRKLPVHAFGAVYRSLTKMNESIQPTLTTHPPAKLNLFLELLSKRQDGFHEIDTVMLPINWCDTLQLSKTETQGISLTVETDAPVMRGSCSGQNTIDPVTPETIPNDQRNLVYRALECFTQAFQTDSGFRCHLTKRIPAGAGLGGASSDAASTLLLAAKLHQIPLQHPMLGRIASALGSDIPFFLGCPDTHSESYNTTCPSLSAAQATGRGEIIRPLKCPTSLHFVVVFPGISLGTPLVYSKSKISPTPRASEPLIRALEAGDLALIAESMSNRLSAPAEKLASEVIHTLESMSETGLTKCQMTGSGSACFGIAKDELTAHSAAESLKEKLGPQHLIQVARNVVTPGLVNEH